MRDINKIIPKITNMRWGALMNNSPTSNKFDEMNKMFPHNGKCHTVFEEEDQVVVDGKRVWKKDPEAWT